MLLDGLLASLFFFFFRNKSVTVVTEDTVVYTDIRSSIIDRKKSQLTQQADKKGKGRKKKPRCSRGTPSEHAFLLTPSRLFPFPYLLPS